MSVAGTVSDVEFKGRSGQESTVYLTQVPNEGAGIGHQIANYIGGVHYARIFGTRHAHAGFKDTKWEKFLGFGEGEVSVAELKKQGYRMFRLPYFDEEKDAAWIRDIIASYEGRKVILQTELDQFYEKQYEEMDFIKRKFESAKARQNEKNSYDEKDIHIAVHIRRGDIVEGQTTGQETLTKRWLTMEYYENVVRDVVGYLQDGNLVPVGRKEDTDKDIYKDTKEDIKEGSILYADRERNEREGMDRFQAANTGCDGFLSTEHTNTTLAPLPDIFRRLAEKQRNGGEIILHIFSQGNQEDYKQFEQFAKVDYCLDKGAMESFLMMVRADILILSKSSFSYKPALLADGIRICPPHFWHGYPDKPDWIVVDEDGHLGER